MRTTNLPCTFLILVFRYFMLGTCRALVTSLIKFRVRQRHEVGIWPYRKPNIKFLVKGS